MGAGARMKIVITLVIISFIVCVVIDWVRAFNQRNRKFEMYLRELEKENKDIERALKEKK